MAGRLAAWTLLLVPFGFLSLGIVHVGHKYAMLIAAMVIASGFVRNIYLRVFICWAAFWQFLLNLAWVSNILPKEYIASGLSMTSYMTCGIIIYLAVVYTKVPKKTYFDIICVSAILQAIIGFNQTQGWTPVYNVLNWLTGRNVLMLLDSTRAVGTLGNNNFLAAYLAFCVPFFFRKHWAWFLCFIIPVLLMCDTTMAIVSLAIGVGWYLGKLRYIAAMAVLALAYALFWDATPFYESNRWEWWAKAMAIMGQNDLAIIVGYGPDARWGMGFPMHNEYLEAVYQWGMVGFACIIGFFFTQCYRDRILTTAFIIIAVNSVGNYPLQLAPSGILFLIVIGLMERDKWLGFPPIKRIV